MPEPCFFPILPYSFRASLRRRAREAQPASGGRSISFFHEGGLINEPDPKHYPLYRPGPWPSNRGVHWRGNVPGNFNFVNYRKNPLLFDITIRFPPGKTPYLALPITSAVKSLTKVAPSARIFLFSSFFYSFPLCISFFFFFFS